MNSGEDRVGLNLGGTSPIQEGVVGGICSQKTASGFWDKALSATGMVQAGKKRGVAGQ